MLKPIESLSEKEKLGLRKSSGKGMAIDTAILVYRLADARLYTLQDMASTMYEPGTPQHRQMVNRLKSFLWYRKVKPEGEGVNAWYGRTVKELLEPRYQYMAERSIALLNALNQVNEVKKQAQITAATPPPQKMVPVTEQATTSVIPEKRKNRKMLLVAISSLVILSCVGAAAFMMPRAYKIFKKRGLGAALRYVYSTEPQYQDDLFRQAWIDYRASDFETAESKANQLLADHITSGKLKADCWYMLGHIRGDTGDYAEALELFDQASSTYQITGHITNRYRCSVSKAQIYLALEEFDQAQLMLDQAYDFYLESAGQIKHLGWHNAVKLRMEFRQQNYEEALELARDLARTYERNNDINGTISAWCDLGFLYMVNGDLQRGLNYTLRAQASIIKAEDPKHHIYNLKNYVLFQSCLGQEPDAHLISEIEQWSRLNSDDELGYYLWFALNYCRGGTNESGATTQTTRH